MGRHRSTLTAAQAREAMERSQQKATRTISAKVHEYVDQAAPAQARRGLQFVCEAGLFGDTFVEYLDAELLELRRRLQAEGMLDAQGRLCEHTESRTDVG